MSTVDIDRYYWIVEVDGEQWIVDGASIEEVIKNVLLEEPDASIDLIERTNISKVII